ncbi:dolichyl-phosphate-mannose-protein mannosyltransferase [Halosimplex carlsbadense 2-9-1]|uniref:Dolichyl-phosphate-mannose-protein mannosyltransferase n=1 Tax=Halosimplex carlsbadense 2-9-1 TaxID=797114 RepID=M0CUD6_9EURY|nr:flippase activity-associated protein Agl23 [Halosimplex carlsbadense]ELZ26846.1 dolichyl-phosphate-mannose-protein mannosyltransferase [Halosimplex carlsbadense 2-9-1]
MSRSDSESDAAGSGDTGESPGPETGADGDSVDPAREPAATDRDPPDPADSTGRFDGIDRTTRWVLAVVAGGLLARLALLGARVAHYDEGRVAWWSNYFLETGQFEYRYIIHGPLVQHVNKFLFDALGANDFTMRLFVALVGAFLPLAALLFREHLDGDEIVGTAFFLAFSPLLLYYSRFFRSTLIAAAFAFVAFGLLVRAYDERSVWYVYGSVAFIALAFTAKENAAVYLLVWVGASALLLDQALFRTGGDRSGFDWARERLDARTRSLGDYVADFLWHGAVAVVLFLAVTLYFYAPRSPDAAAVGFWQAVTNPTLFPDLFDRTLDDVVEGYSYWFGGTTDAGCRQDNIIDAYLCFLGQEVHAIAQSALALTMMAVVGFLAERWGRVRSRAVVLFCAYWGFVSIIGYPLGTDIANAWIAVNALVPLAIPAGVGIALVVDRARDSVHTGSVRFGVTAFALLLIAGYMAGSAGWYVYMNDTTEDNELVQYAQPADDFRPSMAVLQDHAADHEGVDVLFVGSSYVRDSPRDGGIEPLCSSISETLPLQWYVDAYGAEGDCIQDEETAVQQLQNGEVDPLVVIAPNSLEGDLAPAMDGYDSDVYRLRHYGSETVFFSDRTPDRPNGNAALEPRALAVGD